MYDMAYDEEIKEILKDKQWHSTTEIKEAITRRRNKITNWHVLYRTLSKMKDKNMVEKIERKKVILWRSRT